MNLPLGPFTIPSSLLWYKPANMVWACSSRDADPGLKSRFLPEQCNVDESTLIKKAERVLKTNQCQSQMKYPRLGRRFFFFF